MTTASTIRRWIAGFSLFIAVVMVVCGLTVFAPRLKQVAFIVYWLICIGFTGLAGLTAIFDLLAIRRQSREAEKKLIKDTLRQLDRDERSS